MKKKHSPQDKLDKAKNDSGGADSARSGGRTVLLIEDEPGQVYGLVHAFEQQGWNVNHVGDGNLGLATIKTIKPDLVILDLGIPMRSGFLILEQMREEEIDCCRVIVLTGMDGQRHHDYAMALGADAFIRKPFTVDEVIKVAKSLLFESINPSTKVERRI